MFDEIEEVFWTSVSDLPEHEQQHTAVMTAGANISDFNALLMSVISYVSLVKVHSQLNGTVFPVS